MELAQLAPAILLAPFFLLVLIVTIITMPGLVVGVGAVWLARAAYQRHKHRHDAFIEAMLR